MVKYRGETQNSNTLCGRSKDCTVSFWRLPQGVKMSKKILSLIFAVFVIQFLLLSVVFAAPSLTLEEILKNIQSNQNKIVDMYAETTTIISSQLTVNSGQEKPQKMIQKGKMWTKGKDKSKIEITSPMKQITITNGDQMAIINPETGQKLVQDLSKLNGPTQPSKDMDLQKAMEYFDLSVKKTSDGGYVVAGIPKKSNKFLSKMEFYIDKERWVPTKILMYGAGNKLMSQSEIAYKEISGFWVPVKNSSNVNTPAGKMKVEMEFGNIKVNEGIKDSEFKI